MLILILVGGPTTTSSRQMYVGRINTTIISIINCTLTNENVSNYISNFNSGSFTSTQATEIGSSFKVGYFENSTSFAFINDSSDARFNTVFESAYDIVKEVNIDNNLSINQENVYKTFTYGQDIIAAINNLRTEYFLNN